jgi:hypothetical protein
MNADLKSFRELLDSETLILPPRDAVILLTELSECLGSGRV